MTEPPLPATEEHPRLSIAVYTVDGATGEPGEKAHRALGDDPGPLLTGVWPPCRCPRHRDKGSAR